MRVLGSGARSIVIRFIADTARASRDIDNLSLKMKRAFDIAKDKNLTRAEIASKAGFRGLFGRMQFEVLDKLAKKFNLIGESGAEAFSNIALKAGMAATAIYLVGRAITHGLGKVFEYGNIVQGAMLQMSQITGSERKAQYLTKEAIRYSMLTPYKPAETLVATSQAIQSGIDPYKKGGYGLKKNQRAMDIFAGLGSFQDIHGNMIGLNRAVYAILKGDTRLMRPFRQLVDPAYTKAKATGAMVGTQKFNEKFIEELGKIPAIMDMAVKKSEQMQGLWSTITGFVEEVWIAFSGAGEARGVLTFWVQIEDILRDIRDVGQEFMSYIRVGLVEHGAMFGAAIKFIWDALKEVARILGPVMIPLLKIQWEMVRQIFSVLIFLLQTVIKIVKTTVDLLQIFSKFLSIISGTTGSIKGIVDSIVQFTTGLQVMLQLAGIFVDWVLVKIKDTVKAIAGFLTFGLSEALDKLEPILKKIEPLMKVISFLEKGSGASSKVEEILKDPALLGPAGSAVRYGYDYLTRSPEEAFGEGVDEALKGSSDAEKKAIKNIVNIKNVTVIKNASREDIVNKLDQSGKNFMKYKDYIDVFDEAEIETGN